MVVILSYVPAGRFADVSPHIRVECVKFSKFFLLHHPNLVENVTRA